MRRLFAVVLVLSFVAGCGGGGGVVEVDLSDNGSTIRLGENDRLELSLEGNPTTGFTWLVDHAVMLDQIGLPTHEPDSDLIGAPGVTTFVFEPSGSGEGELMLVYRREWEDVAPESTFFIDVIVDA
jgi:inhibitor of cysteine peptidase